MPPADLTVPSYTTLTCVRSLAQLSVTVVALAVSPGHCLFSASVIPAVAGETWIVSGVENASVAMGELLESYGSTVSGNDVAVPIGNACVLGALDDSGSATVSATLLTTP